MSQLKPFLVRADTRVSVYNGDGYDEVMTTIVMATSNTKAEEPLYEETEEDK